jgi:hypothetical protein
MTLKSVIVIAFAIVCVTGWQQAGAQGAPMHLQAMMIQAQHQPAPTDSRLASVEPKLRRVFQFQHYRYIGAGGATIAPGEEREIQLPQGNRLRVKSSGGGRVEVRWFKGGEALLSTGVSLSSDSPVVLGGVPSGDGTLILVLTEK